MMEKTITLPEEFRARMRGFLGEEEYKEFEESYGREQIRALRVNTLKLSPEQFLDLAEVSFPDYESERVPWAENGFYYTETIRPGKHPYHEAGLYYIQEPSAMSAAAFSGVKPGERVLDLCAAPGGKTTQLAAMMRGEGILVANEINPQRARILSQNVERMGIRNAVVTNMDSASLAKRFPSFFDRIIVDAPCSGEGMFMKEEAALTGWSLDNIRLCADRQEEILGNAAQMLCEGGTIVYSTCTFAPEEDEGSVGRFLHTHPEYTVCPLPENPFAPARPEWSPDAADRPEIMRAARLWPHRLRGEGHFLAVLKKSGESVPKVCGDRYRTADKASLAVWNEFKETALSGFDAPAERIIRFGDELYLIPDRISMDGLKVLRPGLDLGTVKKDRFEPSHALALALSKTEFRHTYELIMGSENGLREAIGYLKGGTITIPDTRLKGWIVITADGYPLGWAKAAGGVLKNHFPKGLRWM